MLLETHNDTDTLVQYLGALAAGHVVIPVAAGRDHAAIMATYDPPDTVVDTAGVRHRRREPGHRMHEDLTLLLSTSGSTGSPRNSCGCRAPTY